MIICLCNNVTDKDIKKLQEEGRNLDEIQEMTGFGTNCGSCVDYIKVLREYVDER